MEEMFVVVGNDEGMVANRGVHSSDSKAIRPPIRATDSARGSFSEMAE